MLTYQSYQNNLPVQPAPSVPATAPGLSFTDTERVISAFLSEQDVKPSSLKTYRESLGQFFRWVGNSGRQLQSLTSADIVEYKQYLLFTGHQNLTVRAYIVAVRKFYQWAEGKRLYADIARPVKVPKANQGGSGRHFIKMHLTERQGAELLEHYRNDPRDYAIVNLMLRTGLRTIEVSRATVGDIRMRSGRRILQVWGKGMDTPDPSVFVVLTEAAYGPIRDYLETRPGALAGEPLFATRGRGYNEVRTGPRKGTIRQHAGGHMSPRLIQMLVKNGLRAIGLDDHAYSAHSLRHTTATQIIKNGGTLLDVKRTLRHSSINTSMIYTASIEEEERMNAAPEALLDKSFNTF